MPDVGTIDNPYALAAALVSGRVGPGDTLVLLEGTYSAAQFISTVRGTQAARVTIKAQAGQRVTIDANMQVLGSYTRWEGIEFCAPGFTDRQSDEPTSGPSDINGHLLLDPLALRTQVINCVIHDGHQGVAGTQDQCELYGNLIFYNGWKYGDNPANGSYGHGVYPHNSSPVMRLADNLIFDNFGFGLHAYAADGALDYLLVEGNTFFNNGSPLGNNPPNLHIGGYVNITDPVVRNNVCYYPTAGQEGVNLRVGYSDAHPVSGARITGNLCVGEFALVLKNCAPVEFGGNRLFGYTDGFTPGDYPANTYGTAAECSAQAVVRANEYQAGRGHVTIINPSAADSVSVDASAVLATGAAYRLRNVQDYFTDIQTGTVAQDGTISVDMRASQRTVAAPVGWDAPASVFPAFGCFVLEPA